MQNFHHPSPSFLKNLDQVRQVGTNAMIVILGAVIIIQLVTKIFGGSDQTECFRRKDESIDMEKCIKANIEKKNDQMMDQGESDEVQLDFSTTGHEFDEEEQTALLQYENQPTRRFDLGLVSRFLHKEETNGIESNNVPECLDDNSSIYSASNLSQAMMSDS